MIGGLFVDVSDVSTFQAIYLVDAVSYLPALVLLLGPLRHIAGKVETVATDDAAPMGYLAVLRSPAMAAMTLLSFVSSFVGYSQLNAGMPAYARGVGEVSTRALGFAFGANTLVIVLLQLVVLQRIEGRRRTRVIAVMSVVWAFRGVLLGLSGPVPHPRRGGRWSRPVPRSSPSARRCSSPRSRRWSTTWVPTTCAAATTR